jgi:hypothetical protein
LPRKADFSLIPCGKLSIRCGKGVEKKSKSCGEPVERLGKNRLNVKFCKDF